MTSHRRNRFVALLLYFVVSLGVLSTTAAPATPPKPVLSLQSTTLHWTAIEGVNQYEILTHDLTAKTPATSSFSQTNEAEATVIPGHTLRWRVRARYGFSNEAPWSNAITYTWPE